MNAVSFNEKRLAALVDRFRGKRVAVIGDIMLDQFIFGDAERISPEAPVPVVLAMREAATLGGAGNVAANAAALGGAVSLVGVVGNDAAGRTLFRELKRRGIDRGGVRLVRGRPTTQKMRVVTRGQQLVRVDREETNEIGGRTADQLMRYLEERANGWDCFVVSDYAKGVVTPGFMARLIRFSGALKKPLIGDVKPQNALFFRGATLLTPNHREAATIAGVADMREAGRFIQKRLRCNVLITQGAQGMTLFEKKYVRHFPTQAKEVFDVVGAGDTVAATISLALAAGGTLAEGVRIANHAAGIVVGKIGTATVTAEELKADVRGRNA